MNIVNAPLTMNSNRAASRSNALAAQRSLWHGLFMQPGNKRAGGCFLTAAILIGFAVGASTGNAMLGVWAGLGVGIIAAVAVWLMDKRTG